MARRDKSPPRRPDALTGANDQDFMPYDLGVILLNLGTLPFLACGLLVVVPCSTALMARLLSCVLSYACVILGFIGGLQQAAAVSGSEGPSPVQQPASGAALVLAAILLALCGWSTVALSQYRGVAPGDLLVMSCLYAAQALRPCSPVPRPVLPTCGGAAGVPGGPPPQLEADAASADDAARQAHPHARRLRVPGHRLKGRWRAAHSPPAHLPSFPSLGT